MTERRLRLVSHVNSDGDIIEAWLRHYLALGVTSFHLIVHGPRSENEQLYRVRDAYPIVVEDEYQGEFLATEKLKRVTDLLAAMTEDWVVWVDSDEFLEVPEETLLATVDRLESLHSDVLVAPMVQRLTPTGSLSTPTIIEDPFDTFPLCSIDLYERMGVEASLQKHPLLYYTSSTVLSDGGNHGLPYGSRGRPAPFLGVTHHFKWRRGVRDRLIARAESNHPWRHESATFAAYLRSHDWRLPTEGAFRYSRVALCERGYLRPRPRWKYGLRWSLSRFPEPVDDRLMLVAQRLSRSGPSG
jgi:hypothetical protein